MERYFVDSVVVVERRFRLAVGHSDFRFVLALFRISLGLDEPLVQRDQASRKACLGAEQGIGRHVRIRHAYEDALSPESCRTDVKTVPTAFLLVVRGDGAYSVGMFMRLVLGFQSIQRRVEGKEMLVQGPHSDGMADCSAKQTQSAA